MTIVFLLDADYRSRQTLVLKGATGRSCALRVCSVPSGHISPRSFYSQAKNSRVWIRNRKKLPKPLADWAQSHLDRLFTKPSSEITNAVNPYGSLPCMCLSHAKTAGTRKQLLVSRIPIGWSLILCDSWVHSAKPASELSCLVVHHCKISRFTRRRPSTTLSILQMSW